MRILLIEDEPNMARIVADGVGGAGYLVDQVGSVSEAEPAIALARYALVLLDRRLPDGDGLMLLHWMRAGHPGVPVIILTALDDLASKVGGLDAGADDYLTKPFAKDELLARIRAALRRSGEGPAPEIVCGSLRFAPVSHEVEVGGEAVSMRRRELLLLEALIRRVGRVVGRDTLMNEVYGFDDDIKSNTLDAHVSRLRARQAQLKAGVMIRPVRGVGYMLDAA